MIVNRWKKYKIKPNKRNKSCKNIQINNEINNYYVNQETNYENLYGELIIHNVNINENENENECFICLEVYNDNENTIKLNKMKGYIKECSCDAWIHELCFNKWHIVNKRCPICRTVIVFTKYEYMILGIRNFKKNVCNIIILTVKIVTKTLIFSLFLWVLYRTCSIYFYSFKKTPMLSN